MFSKIWFKEHQELLLWLLNTPLISIWFRWVMRINGDRSSVGNKKIIEIFPNAIKWKAGRKKYAIEFRTHNKFSKRLYYAFYPLWVLIHFWDIIFANNIAPNYNLGFDTLTKYPDGDPETNTFDGTLAEVNATWAGVRNDTSAGAVVDDTSAQRLAHSAEYNAAVPQYVIYRNIFLFDTSALTAGASISAAIYSWYSELSEVSNAEGTNKANLSLVSSNPASNTGIAAGDYNIALWGSTKFATDVTLANFTSASQYWDFALNADGLAAISKTSITKFGIRASNDISNSAPSNRQYTHAYFSEQTGTTKDPKLVITYTVAVDVTVNAGVQSITSSIPAPTISPVRNISYSSSVLASVLNLISPTVLVTIDATILAPIFESVFSLPISTISTIRNSSVSADVLANLFDIPAPTIEAIRNLNIAAGLLTNTFSVLDPTVTPVINITINANYQDLTFSLPASTVSTIRNAEVSVDVLASLFDLPVSTVEAIKNLSVGAVTLENTLNILNPTITTFANASINVNLLTLLGTLPAVLVFAIRPPSRFYTSPLSDPLLRKIANKPGRARVDRNRNIIRLRNINAT